ncbi:hypothetical protein MD484_g5967, partial [Candolleomyces efflorescens]
MPWSPPTGTSRRWWVIAGVTFCILALLYTFQSSWYLFSLKDAEAGAVIQIEPEVCKTSTVETQLATLAEREPWMVPSTSLNSGSPTPNARDNLRNGSHYITGLATAGFTNEFIAYVNMIYLGVLSQRIPIIPPFVPQSHVSAGAGILPFSHIYNLSNLRNALKHPVLEWSDVKTLIPLSSSPTSPPPAAAEHFGCWSVRQQSAPSPNRVPRTEQVLNLDLVFTRVPPMAYYSSSNPGDPHTKFSALAALIWPDHAHPASRNLRLMEQQGERTFANNHGESEGDKEVWKGGPPDEQLACFDFLYWMTSGVEGYEIERRWSLAWNGVGTHLTFTDELVEMTKGYLRRALKLQEGSVLPPMITVHIRRGDFGYHCKQGRKPPCFAPISKYRDLAKKIQDQIFETQKIRVTTVYVASDERDLSFWQEIESFGWTYLNHTTERTTERLGEWYPLLIDKIALSLGVGFVGTSASTFSILNARRVEDWNGGITDYVNPLED